jgi:mono/diheme cytochrome c family protein
MKRALSLFVLLPMALGGCSSEPAPVASFEPNLVHTTKYAIQEELDMDQASADAFWLAETMFGTPDEPKLPKFVIEDNDLASLVSNKNLRRASGPADAEGRGLYRKHCAVCHGITGDGRGPTGAIQMPYPRDYRMGVFKFKSVPRGAKPTKNDLANVIRHGIGGTGMIAIPALSNSDIDALVDYVIYLSWRGELERQAVDGAIFDGIIEDGERIIDPDYVAELAADPRLAEQLEALADKDSKELSESEVAALEKHETHLENWEYAEEYVADIAESWLEANDEVIEVPKPPSEIPVAENYEDVVQFRNGPQADSFAESVQRGQELFTGKIAACSKCHGEMGLGNGQTNDYDDWTKDWTTRIGLKPEDTDSLIPMLARGAFPPRNAMPRNFAEGIFRGGSSSRDLYLRITQGIDGSPMPALTFVDGKVEETDVWHLINFIRSLQNAPEAM